MHGPRVVRAWRMVRPGDPRSGVPGVLERAELPLPPVGPGDAVVEIAGCGVCHTDLSFFSGEVATADPPPLVLGHEISGRVVGGAEDWIGREVIVPAVLPCRRCEVCRAGRPNRCLDQRMPGNRMGGHGGFASHIVAPAAELCPVARRALPLELLAVVADAVTTPYHAARRVHLGPGDTAVIIGAGGGVGSHMVQIAAALGAAAVVAMDVDEARLARNLRHGAHLALNCAGLGERGIREAVREVCRRRNAPERHGWKIFECSGTPRGQILALSLLPFVGTLAVVGYTPEAVPFVLSRLMALDAEAVGVWGCPPELYPEALALVERGAVAIEPFTEARPMSTIREAFAEASAGRNTNRIVLTPDFERT